MSHNPLDFLDEETVKRLIEEGVNQEYILRVGYDIEGNTPITTKRLDLEEGIDVSIIEDETLNLTVVQNAYWIHDLKKISRYAGLVKISRLFAPKTKEKK